MIYPSYYESINTMSLTYLIEIVNMFGPTILINFNQLLTSQSSFGNVRLIDKL